jgi:hypothetical protein
MTLHSGVMGGTRWCTCYTFTHKGAQFRQNAFTAVNVGLEVMGPRLSSHIVNDMLVPCTQVEAAQTGWYSGKHCNTAFHCRKLYIKLHDMLAYAAGKPKQHASCC